MVPMRLFPILLAAAALASCVDKGADTSATLDCAAVAILTSEGTADPCDVEACEICVETCGTLCAVMETYPPLYSCDSERTWDVYDFCDAWEPPA